MLSCEHRTGDQIRVIINDGVAPLNVIEECPTDEHGMCPVDAFVEGQKRNVAEANWDGACFNGFDGQSWAPVPGGWFGMVSGW